MAWSRPTLTPGINRRDFLRRASLVGLSSAALVDPAGGQPAKRVTAETNFGKVRGVEAGGIKIFKGIPYGASTTGSHRFMPPADPARWTGVRDALEYGPSAPQRDPAAP